MITKTSDWYQPADVVLDPFVYGPETLQRYKTGRVWEGGTVAYLGSFGGLVNFPVEAAKLAAGIGRDGAGMGNTTDYGLEGAAWVTSSNYPIYGVGFRGQAIGATFLFPAPSWNYQAEATVIAQSCASFYTYAAAHALGDLSLPWSDPSTWPYGAVSIVGLEWEHALYGDPTDPGNASSSFVSGAMRSTVDATTLDKTNIAWNLGIRVYPSASGGDEAFMHTHGASVTTVTVSPGDPVHTVDAPIPASLPSFPTITGPVSYLDLEALEAAGFPAITASFVHQGIAAGSWNYDVGDGTVDVYNSQRAEVTTRATAVMRPSRVRFTYKMGFDAPLRLFQRDDSQGPVKTPRLGGLAGNVPVVQGPSSLQEPSGPRLPEGGNVYR